MMYTPIKYTEEDNGLYNYRRNGTSFVSGLRNIACWD